LGETCITYKKKQPNQFKAERRETIDQAGSRIWSEGSATEERTGIGMLLVKSSQKDWGGSVPEQLGGGPKKSIVVQSVVGEEADRTVAKSKKGAEGETQPKRPSQKKSRLIRRVGE